MLRPPRVSRWCLLGIASAGVIFLIAATGSPACAQETAAASTKTESDRAEEEYADDDELLEPSNTGYIDDAIVGSKFRLRYDSATGATKPDRAEFIYGKCLCFNKLFGQDAASPGPAENLDFQELELTYERAFSRRYSLFVEIPFRSIDLTIPAGLVGPLELQGPNISNSGLGDIRAGMKYALIAEPDRYLTFQLRGYFASGEAKEALGTGHASIEPGLLYFGRPSERLTLAAELRWWHPLAGSSDPVSLASGDLRTEPPAGTDPRVRNDAFAGDVVRFGFGASYENRGRRISFSPVAELVGWYVLDGYVFPATGLEEADNDTIVNLKLGARISRGGSGSFYLGYGFPLTNEDWYDGIVRVEYRIALASPKRH